ncbi:MAG: hypothetical protein JNL98_05445 [Bryobacterales bacterium]|nr:hypothetical protein [Bryobacterales bacterium]
MWKANSAQACFPKFFISGLEESSDLAGRLGFLGNAVELIAANPGTVAFAAGPDGPSATDELGQEDGDADETTGQETVAGNLPLWAELRRGWGA